MDKCLCEQFSLFCNNCPEVGGPGHIAACFTPKKASHSPRSGSQPRVAPASPHPSPRPHGHSTCRSAGCGRPDRRVAASACALISISLEAPDPASLTCSSGILAGEMALRVFCPFSNGAGCWWGCFSSFTDLVLRTLYVH